MAAQSAKVERSTEISVFSGYAEYSTKLADFRLIYRGGSVELEDSRARFVPEMGFNPEVLMAQRENASELAGLLRQSAEHAAELGVYNTAQPIKRISAFFDDLLIYSGSVAVVDSGILRIDERGVDARTVSHEFFHLIDPVSAAANGKRHYRGRLLRNDDSTLMELSAEFFAASLLSSDKSGMDRTLEILKFYSAIGVDVLKVIKPSDGARPSQGLAEPSDKKVTIEEFKYIAGGIMAVAAFTKNNFDVDATMKELAAAKSTPSLLESLAASRVDFTGSR